MARTRQYILDAPEFPTSKRVTRGKDAVVNLVASEASVLLVSTEPPVYPASNHDLHHGLFRMSSKSFETNLGFVGFRLRLSFGRPICSLKKEEGYGTTMIRRDKTKCIHHLHTSLLSFRTISSRRQSKSPQTWTNHPFRSPIHIDSWVLKRNIRALLCWQGNNTDNQNQLAAVSFWTPPSNQLPPYYSQD